MNKNVGKGNYVVVYKSNKQIYTIKFGDLRVSTSKEIYASNDYDDFVNFIYDNQLYLNEKSKVNFKHLKRVIPNVEETLFLYDD